MITVLDVYKHRFAFKEHLPDGGSSIEPIPLNHKISELVLVLVKSYLTSNFPIEGNMYSHPPQFMGELHGFLRKIPECHWTKKSALPLRLLIETLDLNYIYSHPIQ